MSRLRRLIHEIHRRSLWQVLFIYLVGAGVGLEVVQGLTDALGLPAWFPPLAILLFIVGLPIVLATAFVQEGVQIMHKTDPTLLAVRDVATREARHEPRGPGRLLNWRNAALGGVLALALWGVVAAGWWLLAGRIVRTAGVIGLTAEATERRSIAVLPFDNMSGDPENEYFSDGMTDDIITQLSKIANLKVISRTSVMRYKGREEKNLREIGAELGADAILEGAVRRSNGRVRINAQLIDATSDEHLWAETYDRDLTDIFAIQSEVAQRIATAMQARLTAAERERLDQRPTESIEAYNLYLQGRYFWNKRTAEGLERAIEYFEQGIAQDSNYALAWAGLADTHSILGDWGYRSPEETFPRGKLAALKAIEIDESLAEAHAALASILEFYDRDWSAAEREYRRALELSPDYATAHHWYAIHLSRKGRMDEAIREMERALELDPLSLIINTNRALLYRRAGDGDRAMGAYQRVLGIDPNFVGAHLKMGWLHEEQRRLDEAIDAYGRAVELSGGLVGTGHLGHAYGISGRRAEARAILEELLQRSEQRYVPPSEIAIVYAGLGDMDTAFEWLERAIELHDPTAVWRIQDTAAGESFGADPRLKTLFASIGLPVPVDGTR